MKNSAHEDSSTRCFSGFLRRLLCTGNLQTHPSDQFEANNKEKDDQTAEKCLKSEDNVKQLSSPGVVAKLMGLDSLPNTPLTPRDRTLGSYFRSRSVNSIDFLSHFDPTRKGNNHIHHRRVRTSVSFRENDDYGLVLHLEKVDENSEYEHQKDQLMIKRRANVNYQKKVKKNESLMEKKVSTKRPIKKLEAYQKKDFRGKTRVNLKEIRPVLKPLNSEIESKCVKKKKKKKKILGHSQCSLKKIHPENNLSEVRRRVSSHAHNGEVRAIIKDKSQSQNLENNERCYYKTMVEEICRLTDEDLNKNFVSNFEDFEEICQQFGHEILQVMLKQLVDELVLVYGTSGTKH